MFFLIVYNVFLSKNFMQRKLELPGKEVVSFEQPKWVKVLIELSKECSKVRNGSNKTSKD